MNEQNRKNENWNERLRACVGIGKQKPEDDADGLVNDFASVNAFKAPSKIDSNSFENQFSKQFILRDAGMTPGRPKAPVRTKAIEDIIDLTDSDEEASEHIEKIPAMPSVTAGVTRSNVTLQDGENLNARNLNASLNDSEQLRKYAEASRTQGQKLQPSLSRKDAVSTGNATQSRYSQPSFAQAKSTQVKVDENEFFKPRPDTPQQSKPFKEVIDLTTESEGSGAEIQIPPVNKRLFSKLKPQTDDSKQPGQSHVDLNSLFGSEQTGVERNTSAHTLRKDSVPEKEAQQKKPDWALSDKSDQNPFHAWKASAAPTEGQKQSVNSGEGQEWYYMYLNHHILYIKWVKK